jgi:tetratricopeptide (TPR) repeat protein
LGRPAGYSSELLGTIAWPSPGEAQAFATAVNRLRSAARGEDQEVQAGSWLVFQQQAAAWRALAVKPAISEEVRRHRLLAEHSVNEKQFDAAVEEYEAGLEIDPTWPEGHFNSALLCAELGYYSEALHHMRAYLELVPEAQDAQSARDQMIIWEADLRKIR